MSYLTARQRREMEGKRLCYVCRQPIPQRLGIWNVELQILVHERACGQAVLAISRSYDKSRRGKRVPANVVRHQLEDAWRLVANDTVYR